MSMQNAHIPIYCPTDVQEDFLRWFLEGCFLCDLNSPKGYVVLSNLNCTWTILTWAW